MKSKLGNFSNANALLVSFNLTHKELITAKAIAPKAFKIMSEDGKSEEFKLFQTPNASASRTGVSFPFAHENESRKVEVMFTIDGVDVDTVTYNAASIVQNLVIVEKAIIKELKAMKDVAKGIEVMSFEDSK